MNMLHEGVVEAEGGLLSLEWAMVCRSKIPGERCGDGSLVRADAAGILVAVADGAGHGEPAAVASEACLSALATAEIGNLQRHFENAHRLCRETRGAALGLASIDLRRGRLAWAAVGEVGGVLIRSGSRNRSDERSIVQRGGTLGYRLPSLILQQCDLSSGDSIVMTTDGVRQGFDELVTERQAAGSIAKRVLVRCGRDDDDALVLVACCRAA